MWKEGLCLRKFHNDIILLYHKNQSNSNTKIYKKNTEFKTIKIYYFSHEKKTQGIVR